MSDQTLKEIKNELRKEQLVAFIKKYKVLIIVTVLTFVIGLTSFFWYKHHINQKAISNSILFMDAQEKLSSNNIEEALDLFDYLIKNGTNGYKMMASLEKVSYFITKGDIENATLLLQDARKINIPKYYKDMMETMEYNIRFNNQAEDLDKLVEDIKSNLNKKSSFYFFNLEIYGGVLVQKEEYTEALDVFDQIILAENVPQDVLERAKRVKGLLQGYVS